MSSSHPPSDVTSEVTAARIVSLEDAWHLVERHAASVSPAEIETVDMLLGRGRVLAEGTLEQLRDRHHERDLEELFFQLISQHDETPAEVTA